MKKPRSVPYLRKFFAILVAMAAFLFSQNEARAAITVAQITRTVTTTAAATQATAAFTPVANTLYLMWTIQTIGTGPPTVPTATCANGLAMVQVNTVTFATTATQLKRLTLFRAMKPSGLANGACTIAWGQTTTGHGHVIVGFTGVDSSGTDGSGAVVQSVTGRTDSATAAAGLSITLAALQAGSTTAGGFSNAVNNASSLTAGAGYTAGTGGSFNTPPTSIRAEWRTAGITTVNMTQSATSHIGGIAVEVKPAPTAPTAPTVTTNAATALTASGATLNGTVSSNGADTAVSFEYGLTVAYGSSIAATPPTVLGTTTSATPVSAAVTGLTCNTLYHFRAKGVNSLGTTNGGDLTFTTSACPPQVTLTPASGGSAVPSNTAPACGAAGTWTTLTGPVVAETAAAQIGAGTIVLNAPAGFEFNPASPVTILLTGGGNQNNNINNVSTGTSMATTVTASTITFTVNAGQLSTVANTLTWQNIQVRPTLSTPLASGNITHTGTSAITGVTNGVTNFGTLTEVASTPVCNTPPTAITGAATVITFATATLNGTVSSNGADTTVSFEWGQTTAYGQTIPAIPSLLLASAVGAPVSADLIGLNCNTLFHYRVKATNSAGTSYGAGGTFTTGVCTAPFPATACAATRYGADLGCTSADVGLTNIAIAPGSITSCVSGTPVVLNLDLTLNFSSPDRYDVGIFIANDGKLPTLLPANGGSGSCSVDVLPTTPPFLDLDGVPQGTLDTCGDGNSSIDDSLLPGGTIPLGDGVKRMTGVTLPCYASATSGGTLFVPFVITWDSQRSPLGSLCTSNLYPVPNTKSRCGAPASSVAVNVVVLPVITKTNGGTEINPGANTTYTVVINNNSGGTLLDMVFTDPAVTNLTVNSVSCAAAGATCPVMTSAAMITAMQGAGITIPSASLPNNSSLTFTVNATLSGAATPGTNLVNTARVTIPLPLPAVPPYPFVEATDTDLIVFAPSAAKSFAPGTITEGASSVLTITLTNPTATAITGVSFTDTYPVGLVNTASAGGATTCGGIVTAANGGSSVALSGGTIPASGSCTVTVNVTSAVAGSYINSTGTVTHASGTIPSASATLTVNAAAVGAFNAGEVGTWDSNFPLPTPIPHIYTKLAGTGFNLQIAALKTDGTRLTSYSKTVVVELLDSSVSNVFDPATNCDSGWILLTPAVSISASFAPSNTNKGVITVTFPAVPNAYSNVRVRVTEGTTKIGCSTDYFAIRPSAVTLFTNASAVAPSASATPIFGAGTPFTLYATTTTGINYNGTLTLDTGKLTAQITSQDTSQQSGGTVGALSPTTLVANPLIPLPSSNATYSEVGYLYLGPGAYRNDTYASGDASFGDCIQNTSQYTNPPVPDYLSDVLVNGQYGCSVGNKTPVSLGRFVPDHFDTVVELTANLPMPCPIGLIPGCPTSYDGFVYSGQPFSVKVTAKNAGGNTTQNYQGFFAKAVTLSAWDALGSIVTPPGGSLLANTAIAAAMFGAVTPGAATTSTPVYTLATVTTAPTDIYLRAVDADGVTSRRATNPPTSVEGGVKVVSGRVKIGNAYGSELLPLPMTATVQYYNGTYWVTSATDYVTSLTLTATYDVVKGVTTGTTTPSPTGSAMVSGGVLNILLGKPTAGPGSATINPGVPSYLPLLTPGLATFGIYKGNNRFIYLREMY